MKKEGRQLEAVRRREGRSGTAGPHQSGWGELGAALSGKRGSWKAGKEGLAAVQGEGRVQ